ncbi:MAG: hypothetical protein JSV32_06910 [Dehalococcoidia bacterium]|nr:MAG: hypothetical protein JSV32_06910 [Dehalococcoidia bacterium]
MSPEVRDIVSLFHLISMLFMSAPLYMLIMANERARFSVPPGYNVDRYLENIVKSQPIRCYGFLAGIVITGTLLTVYRPEWSPDPIWTNWALIIKMVVVTVIFGLLSYVHFYIQPRIDALFTGLNPGEEIPKDKKPILSTWRARRKKLSAFCLFLVLTGVITGVTVVSDWAPWLVVVLLAVAAIFAWRVYRKPVRFGWF